MKGPNAPSAPAAERGTVGVTSRNGKKSYAKAD